MVVHVEPIAVPGGGRYHGRPSAGRRGTASAPHGIRIYEENRQRWLELHLEVSESLLLDEAHRQATEFERALRREPSRRDSDRHAHRAHRRRGRHRFAASPPDKWRCRRRSQSSCSDYPLPVKPHDLRVQQVGGELAVSFHCTLDASTAITEAHDLTVRLEEYLRPRAGPGPRGDPRRAQQGEAGLDKQERKHEAHENRTATFGLFWDNHGH